MKNKALSVFLIILSFVAAMVFALPMSTISVVGVVFGILLGLIPILIAYFVVKDKKLASKTLQPFLIIVAIGVLKLFLDFIFFFVFTTASSYYQAQQAYVIIQMILAILVYVLEIVVLVFFCLKKDAPWLGSLADKIIGIKKEKSQNSVQSNEQKNNSDDETKEIDE